VRHDFTTGTFDRFTRDRLTGYHRFLYCGHHQGTAYYLPTTVQAATTSADYAHVRRLGRIGIGEVFALGELRERHAGQFIPEYAPDRTAGGHLRAGNDAPIDPSGGFDPVTGHSRAEQAIVDSVRETDPRDGVHQSHCCSVHGCKYDDKDCPVGVTGRLAQDHPCEQCQDDDEAGATLSREHVRNVILGLYPLPFDRHQTNTLLRRLGLGEIEEPHKIVTVEVKVKTRDTLPVAYVREAIDGGGLPVGMEIVSFEVTGTEEVR
jgi:hypothetical protein